MACKTICHSMHGCGKSDTNNDRLGDGRAKMLGYIWAVAFLVWSTPDWVYPAIQMNQGKSNDCTLPFQRFKAHFTP